MQEALSCTACAASSGPSNKEVTKNRNFFEMQHCLKLLTSRMECDEVDTTEDRQLRGQSSVPWVCGIVCAGLSQYR